jgi:hypothetical protein
VRHNVTFAAATLALWAAALSPVAAQSPGRWPLQNLAVRVTAVTPGMPAARQGIVVGDIIVSVDGNRVASTDDLGFFLRRAGRVARLEVIPWRRPMDGPVFLDVFPVNGRIGINATQTTLPAWSPPPNQNLAVRVTAVTPGMPAARQGIAVGDIIVSVNGNRVASTDDLVYFLWRAGRVARLEVIPWRRPQDRPVFLNVNPVNGRIGINATQLTLPAGSPRPNPTPFSAPIQPQGGACLRGDAPPARAVGCRGRTVGESSSPAALFVFPSPQGCRQQGVGDAQRPVRPGRPALGDLGQGRQQERRHRRPAGSRDHARAGEGRGDLRRGQAA